MDDRYLSPAQTTELLPGVSVAALKRMRAAGTGPTFLMPTPRRVLYREADIHEWLAATERDRRRK